MLTLVVDANFFHEFRPLDTLPWSEITDTDAIIFHVSDPVQTELDEQRLSSRADSGDLNVNRHATWGMSV